MPNTASASVLPWMWAMPQSSRTIVTCWAWRSQRVGSGTGAPGAATGAHDARSRTTSDSWFIIGGLSGAREPHGSPLPDRLPAGRGRDPHRHPSHRGVPSGGHRGGVVDHGGASATPMRAPGYRWLASDRIAAAIASGKSDDTT